MNQLKPTNNSMPAIDSREVARMVSKEHHKLLRDIREYISQMLEANEVNPVLDTPINPEDYFIEGTYIDAQNKVQPKFDVTKIGCDFIANKLTGVKGTAFTAFYTKRFDQMENALSSTPAIPQTFAQALRLAADQAEQLEAQKPLVAFAETCAASEDSILVRELAKVASKHGLSIGEKRLYQKLRDWRLIFPNGREPYQEYIDRGYFEITQGVRETAKGPKLYKVTRVTPKGQIYILDRLKKDFSQGA